jgi:NAD-dependent dihydropyrimidine dehydrogenase PreA subunit
MLKYLRNVVTLQLDVKVCNGCGMCVTVCPHAVFDIKDRKAIIADRDACIECGACAINCPVNAIRVQTGAGCAAGILLSAIGKGSCCSIGCGVSPAVAGSNQAGCCDSRIGNAGIDSGTPKALSMTYRQKEIGMTKSFIIYESAMCCSSGVCGPSPDKSLIELQDTLDKLKDMGAQVERYSITGSPKKFRENPEVIKLMQERQIKALPITTYDGQVVKVGGYPSMDELRKYFQVSNEDLSAAAEEKIGSEACCSRRETTGNEGCCAGQNVCDISCGPNYKGQRQMLLAR